MKTEYVLHDIPESDMEFWIKFHELLQKDAELISCDLGQFSGIDYYHYMYKDSNFIMCFESKDLFAVGGF